MLALFVSKLALAAENEPLIKVFGTVPNVEFHTPAATVPVVVIFACVKCSPATKLVNASWSPLIVIWLPLPAV